MVEEIPHVHTNGKPEPVAAVSQTVWTGDQWEYHMASGPADPQQILQCCSFWGNQGWELAGNVPAQIEIPSMSSGGILQKNIIAGVMLIFKRKKQ